MVKHSPEVLASEEKATTIMNESPVKKMGTGQRKGTKDQRAAFLQERTTREGYLKGGVI